MVSTRLSIPSLSSNVKPEFLPNLKDAMMQLGVFPLTHGKKTPKESYS